MHPDKLDKAVLIVATFTFVYLVAQLIRAAFF